MTQTCEQCDEVFHAPPSQRAKFCSRVCADKARRLRQKTCPTCGSLFTPDTRVRQFCSKSCSAKARTYPELRNPGWRERYEEQRKAKQREQYASDPVYRQKVNARRAALASTPDGKPCEKCGADNAERHHDDYASPEVVRFLCHPCHIRHHREDRGHWGCPKGSRRQRAYRTLRETRTSHAVAP
jgi:hypothetical protein